jgi:ABC-type transport system involved in multi-copper enzyme maturation permease subunit
VIRATLRTITGRGAFRTAVAVVLGAVLVAVLARVALEATRPERFPSAGGEPLLDVVSAAAWFFGTIAAVLIGALAGSFDASEGTLRYLFLTGASRFSVFAARSAAVVLGCVLVLVPALAAGLVAAAALPHEPRDDVSGSDLVAAAWQPMLWAVVFGLIAMGIGSFLRSNGGAIAISLVFAFAASPALALLEQLSPTLGELTLLPALDRLTGGEGELAVPVAGLVVATWVAGFLALGASRVLRDEV